jgi:hypothetical protein
MEQGETPALPLPELRAPVLRRDLQYRPLAAGRVFVYHPQVAAQILEARAVAGLLLCRGQLIREMLPEVRRAMDYDCTEDEWVGFLNQVSAYGFFEGVPKRSPRVRLFDPAPAIDFLTRRCRWLFTTPAVVLLFVLLLAGLWRLLSHWSFFVAEVTRATALYPLPSLLLYYFCFLPVGLLHELAHGVVCRWFGGDVVEVGLRKDSANLYVLSNTAPLLSARARIFYFAGGAFLDMFIFFALVNIWLAWPNYFTLMFLLPQALFVLQFSYAMEEGSDLSRIVSQWTGIREARGRWAFVRQFFTARRERPANIDEKRRAAVYLASVALQLVAAAWLFWSFRAPVEVHWWPGAPQWLVARVPLWPPLLYLVYRLLRHSLMNYRTLFPVRSLRPASAAST